MATKIEAARLLTLKAARMKDAGERSDLEAGMAKLFASETGKEVVEESFRIHGGYGYSKEYEIERLYRDAPLLLIGEGTSEIQRMVIGKKLLAAEQDLSACPSRRIREGADRAGRRAALRRAAGAAQLQLVIRLELRAHGRDVPIWRVEVPGPKIDRGPAADARIDVSVARPATSTSWRRRARSRTGPGPTIAVTSRSAAIGPCWPCWGT